MTYPIGVAKTRVTGRTRTPAGATQLQRGGPGNFVQTSRQSSAEAMRQLAESRAAIEAGDVLDGDELASLMVKRSRKHGDRPRARHYLLPNGMTCPIGLAKTDA